MGCVNNTRMNVLCLGILSRLNCPCIYPFGYLLEYLDILLDIHKITGVWVESSVQSRISIHSKFRAQIFATPISKLISVQIRCYGYRVAVYYGYPWLYGSFDADIRAFTDIQADIRTHCSTMVSLDNKRYTESKVCN